MIPFSDSLPAPLRRDVPVLVIGTGISGLYTALKLAEGGTQVLLVTKSSLFENNSRYAQGGIAAVLPSNVQDSLDLHLKDTLLAGAGLCNEPMATRLLSQSFDAILDLLRLGVPFDKTPQGDLATTLEAGHSIQRIIHAGGDATGASVEMALIQQVSENPNIEVLEYAQAVRLHTHPLAEGKARVGGALVVSLKDQTVFNVQSHYTILATGGLGRLFTFSTNPAGSTGDGFALAYEAGAVLKDMEFIQFHPTAFYHQGQVHFLVSEVLRGEGGILRNADGIAFAKNYHAKGELAPRDIVSRAIFFEMQQTKPVSDHVYLDITHLPPQHIENRFPTILKNCLAYGVDIRTQWIPVTPAAHYMMGGVSVNGHAQSSVEGLYVVGETAHTGIHGANRLASNSLLECVVLAKNAAASILSALSGRPHAFSKALLADSMDIPLSLPSEQQILLAEILLTELHQALWRYAGLVRTQEGLTTLLHSILTLKKQAVANNMFTNITLGPEVKNQLILAELIATAAIQRTESRGAHYREDFPDTLPHASHSEIEKTTTETFALLDNKPTVSPPLAAGVA